MTMYSGGLFVFVSLSGGLKRGMPACWTLRLATLTLIASCSSNGQGLDDLDSMSWDGDLGETVTARDHKEISSSGGADGERGGWGETAE
jgi:hypothetical protein